jgi:hypothetical protein
MVAVLRGSVSTGAKEDHSSAGRVWAAGFHHVTARSTLAGMLTQTVYFFNALFFSARGKPQLLNQWIRGHTCILLLLLLLLLFR